MTIEEPRMSHSNPCAHSQVTDSHDCGGIAEQKRRTTAALNRPLAYATLHHPGLDVRAVAVHGTACSVLVCESSGSL